MDVTLVLIELASFFFVYAVLANRLMGGCARRRVERHAGHLRKRGDEAASLVSIMILVALPMAAFVGVAVQVEGPVPAFLYIFWGIAWSVSMVPGGRSSRRLLRAAGIDPDER